MLADKLKIPGGGMRKGGPGMPGAPRQSVTKPVVENNANVMQILEEQPFKRRKDKRKPTRKVFVEELVDEDD